MEPWLIFIIVIASLLVAACVLWLAGAALSEKSVFGKRADKNPLLKYFTAEDFNLTATPVALKSGKTTLNGFIYTASPDEMFRNAQHDGDCNSAPCRSEQSEEPPAATNPQNPQNAIVFCHGMGPGHIAYTTEIAFFCKLGFAVIAIDNRGCNLSQGKNMKGMYSGVQTAIAAATYARANYKGKVYLVGHSWGGYSALCASKKVKVDKVIAIAPPDSPAKTMSSGAAPLIGKPLAASLRPFWHAVNFFKFGFKGNTSAGKSATKNGTPTLIIHGDCDNVVTKNCSAYKTAKGAHIKKHLAAGKAHNPYNTVKAEEKLKQLLQTLASKTLTAEEKQKFFKEFDFIAATEEDEKVMQLMAQFLLSF
ncbi:MAG: lysophospholipase [Clostridia bacterium]|nr:lysophospholipase [Clostridia bacterium]